MLPTIDDLTDAALEPCPFCKSAFVEDTMRTGAIVCQDCGASAPSKRTWNRRTADARVIELEKALLFYATGEWCIASLCGGVVFPAEETWDWPNETSDLGHKARAVLGLDESHARTL